MFKLIIFNYLKGVVTIFLTTAIIYFFMVGVVGMPVDIVRHLAFVNGLFWGFQYGRYISVEIKKFQEEKNKKN